MIELARQLASDGYVSSLAPTVRRTNSFAKGSSNYLLTGAGRGTAWSGALLQAGVTGSRALFQIPDGGYAGLGDGATAGVGSVAGLVARAIAYIGQGALYINGVSRSVSASTALQIILYKSGSYSGAGTGPFTAGMAAPSAPTIAAHSANASTTNFGTTSTVHWFVRSATGGRSKKSAPSNVAVVDHKTLRHTVAAGDLTTATTVGADRLGIGVTTWGAGATGPHYEEREIAISSLTTVDGVGNSVELQWSSAALSGAPLAPLDDDPPPAGVFVLAIEDVLAVIGCYGDVAAGVSATSPGTAIAVSLPVLIESFPADNLLFLPEAPTGVLPRASDGFAFVACKNSLHALVYTGGSPALSLQTVWASTGIAAQHNMFLAEGGRLYAFSNGKRGIVRIGAEGEPDTEFAKDVSDDTSAWVAADVVGGWDVDNQLACFAHGKTILAFNSQLGRWCAPLDMSAFLTTNEKICAAVTVQGKLLFATRDTVTTGAALKLWALHGGAGTIYVVRLPWEFAGLSADELFRVETLMRAEGVSNVNLNVFTNGNGTTPKYTKLYTLSGAGIQHLTPIRCNVRGAKSWCVEFTHLSAGGDAGLEAVRVLGERSGVII
jgi:hypothetical protein